MLVQINNLVKRYGDMIALDHLNLEVKEGEIFGLLGPNGSGKTTAINCLLSLLQYDKGTINLFGKPMSPTAYDLKRNIGVVMQNVAVFNELNVYENIDYFCGLYIPDKQKRKQLVEETIQFVGLDAYRKFRPKKLSGGLLRRLNIACGIAHKPKLILLDEPTVAVDPQSRNAILEGIRRLNAEGATVIYTSHYMEEIEQLCTRIAILDRGRVIASGTKEELKSMISTGEKLVAEVFTISEKDLDAIRGFQGVKDVEYDDDTHMLTVRTDNETGTSLAKLVTYFGEKKIGYGKLYTERPTLNDVFLEITGKALRD